tara:strand:+ start:388 stop:561 length:174 start_codon:yes stop_codon:yes gene_type:complete
MIITEAKYSADNYGNNICIIAMIDGTQSAVPLDPANRHYAEILKQVKEGTLTIEDAD